MKWSTRSRTIFRRRISRCSGSRTARRWPCSPVSSTGTNALASLPDRQTFLAEAARHVAHARRSKHPLCLALIAFDHGTTGSGRRGACSRGEVPPRGNGAMARRPAHRRPHGALGRGRVRDHPGQLHDGQRCPAVLAPPRIDPGGAFVFGRPRVLSGDGDHRRSRGARRRLPRAGDRQGPRPDRRRGSWSTSTEAAPRGDGAFGRGRAAFMEVSR